MVKIVIRADSGFGIGVGHLYRCLTLALALKKQLKADVTFICRKHEGNANQLILDNGFTLFELPCNIKVKVDDYASWLGVAISTEIEEVENCFINIGHIDWLVVDHYAIDDFWQLALKSHYQKLLVIDDLANRHHLADILIDQTYGIDTSRYKPFVKASTNLLLGSEYAILRDDFANLRKAAIKKRQSMKMPKRLLIFISAMDIDGLTLQTLKAVKGSGLDLMVDVIISKKSKDSHEIANFIKKYPEDNLYLDCKNVAEIMLNADLAIGAAGCVSWERATLGLPTILISIANNQYKIAQQLADNNVVSYLGNKESISFDNLITSLIHLIDDNEKYQKFVKNSFEITDGLGVKKIICAMNDEK